MQKEQIQLLARDHVLMREHYSTVTTEKAAVDAELASIQASVAKVNAQLQEALKQMEASAPAPRKDASGRLPSPFTMPQIRSTPAASSPGKPLPGGLRRNPSADPQLSHSMSGMSGSASGTLPTGNYPGNQSSSQPGNAVVDDGARVGDASGESAGGAGAAPATTIAPPATTIATVEFSLSLAAQLRQALPAALAAAKAAKSSRANADANVELRSDLAAAQRTRTALLDRVAALQTHVDALEQVRVTTVRRAGTYGCMPSVIIDHSV